MKGDRPRTSLITSASIQWWVSARLDSFVQPALEAGFFIAGLLALQPKGDRNGRTPNQFACNKKSCRVWQCRWRKIKARKAVIRDRGPAAVLPRYGSVSWRPILAGREGRGGEFR